MHLDPSLPSLKIRTAPIPSFIVMRRVMRAFESLCVNVICEYPKGRRNWRLLARAPSPLFAGGGNEKQVVHRVRPFGRTLLRLALSLPTVASLLPALLPVLDGPDHIVLTSYAAK